jgi:SnoaL-like domain
MTVGRYTTTSYLQKEEQRFMAEQRVPNLEEMDEQQAERFLTELFSNLSPEEEYAIRHEDYVMEMPQSEERIRGREKMRQFQQAYPTPPSIQLRRVLVKDGLWVVEGVNDYGGGQVFNVVLIIELRDGKMFRDTRYYAQPFEVPNWRAQWVERMEP